jgi:hypothetical protein
MPRATISPARALAIFAAALVAATGTALLVGASPAQAAKPCWERVIDDWLDNGRIDGVYSARCLEDARKRLPEDVRAYSDAEEKIDAKLQESGRSAQGGTGGGSDNGSGGGGSGGGGSGGGSDDPNPPATTEPDPGTGPRNEGPIQEVLGAGTTDSTSIPLPLIILAALALLLMAAGAAGLIARKIQARRSTTG